MSTYLYRDKGCKKCKQKTKDLKEEKNKTKELTKIWNDALTEGEKWKKRYLKSIKDQKRMKNKLENKDREISQLKNRIILAEKKEGDEEKMKELASELEKVKNVARTLKKNLHEASVNRLQLEEMVRKHAEEIKKQEKKYKELEAKRKRDLEEKNEKLKMLLMQIQDMEKKNVQQHKKQNDIVIMYDTESDQFCRSFVKHVFQTTSSPLKDLKSYCSFSQSPSAKGKFLVYLASQSTQNRVWVMDEKRFKGVADNFEKVIVVCILDATYLDKDFTEGVKYQFGAKDPVQIKDLDHGLTCWFAMSDKKYERVDSNKRAMEKFKEFLPKIPKTPTSKWNFKSWFGI